MIYKEMCARCHGAKGEGTKKYEHPLTGDWSVPRLAKVIDHTMPEDDPDKLDLEQSRRGRRVHPRRLLLAGRAGEAQSAAGRTGAPHGQPVPQLGGRHHRQLPAGRRSSTTSAASAANTSTPATSAADSAAHRAHRPRGGLRLQDGRARRLPRTPRTKFDPQQFSIRWEGSVIAPDTGTYEFVRPLRSRRAVVGERQSPVPARSLGEVGLGY